MATIIKSNSKQGAKSTTSFVKEKPETKLGENIPTNSPKQSINISVRPYPEASKKT